MNTTWHNAPPYTAEQWARLHDEAVLRAHALRAEAMDSFWRDLGDALVSSRDAAQRAATRLAHRLQRHGGVDTGTPRRGPVVEA